MAEDQTIQQETNPGISKLSKWVSDTYYKGEKYDDVYAKLSSDPTALHGALKDIHGKVYKETKWEDFISKWDAANGVKKKSVPEFLQAPEEQLSPPGLYVPDTSGGYQLDQTPQEPEQNILAPSGLLGNFDLNQQVPMGSDVQQPPVPTEQVAALKQEHINDQHFDANPVESLGRTIVSGLVDQLPKEYYLQRLRMSKGDFGDLFDSRSDINQFDNKDKLDELLKPFNLRRSDFQQWNNKQPSKIRTKSFSERGDLFLREKIGEDKINELKQAFEVENARTRKGFSDEVDKQTLEAQTKLVGVVQDLRDVKSAGDFLNFAGNMIGQALYRAPTSIVSGGVGSFVAESSAVYDRQIDLIAEKNGISREEVIKQGLDEPAAGQALAVLAGSLDAVSAGNMIGLFRKAVAGQLEKSTVRKFTESFAKAALPEAGTEALQGELEELGATQGAGVEYSADPWRIATGAVGGIIGGGVLGTSVPSKKAVEQPKVEVEKEVVPEETKTPEPAVKEAEVKPEPVKVKEKPKEEPVAEKVEEPAPKATPEETNTKELQLLEDKIADPKEPEDEKRFWKDDIKTLKSNPKQYWNDFAMEGTDPTNPRIKEILDQQKFYNDAKDQKASPEEQPKTEPEGAVSENIPKEKVQAQDEVKPKKKKVKKVPEPKLIDSEIISPSPEKTKRPTLRDNVAKKYGAVEPSSPRVVIQKFIATGGFINSKEVKKRTGYGHKDLHGLVAKKGKSYDDLVQMIREETGNDNIEEDEMNRMIDTIVQEGKGRAFQELRDIMSKAQEPKNVNQNELSDFYDENGNFNNEYFLEQFEKDPELVQDVLGATREEINFIIRDAKEVQVELNNEKQIDNYWSSLTDDQTEQIYDEQEKAFQEGTGRMVEETEPRAKEVVGKKPQDESSGTAPPVFDKAAEIKRKQAVVTEKEKVLKRKENELSKLSGKLSENLKENQQDMFGQNKPQSMFDDRADQSKIVEAKRKEVEDARKELDAARKEVEGIGQLEIETDEAPAKTPQAQHNAQHFDGRSIYQRDLASKRISKVGLKNIVANLKKKVKGMPDVIMDAQKVKQAWNDFLTNGGVILRQIIGEEGASGMDVNDIVIGQESAANRLNNLSIAKKMEEAGKSPKEIWIATGWERTSKEKDAKWGYEIEYGDFVSPRDLVDQMIPKPGKTKEFRLRDIFRAKELFNAYPEIKDYTVIFTDNPELNYEAQFSPEQNTITVNLHDFKRIFDGRSRKEILEKTKSLRGLRRLIIHELQHAAQVNEGFAEGGYPGMPLLRELEGSPHENYRRLAGETQARNAAKRADLDDDSRVRNTPESTEDIRRIDQIIIEGNIDPEAMLAQQPQGAPIPNGFIYRDQIYINPDAARMDTAIHEFGHLWTLALKHHNKALYALGAKLIKESSYFKEVQNNPNYAGLTESEMIDEAMAMGIGEKGALIWDQPRWKRWWNDFVSWVKQRLGLKKAIDFNTLTVSEWLNIGAKELLTPGEVMRLSSVHAPETALFKLKSFKTPQDAFKAYQARVKSDEAIAIAPNQWNALVSQGKRMHGESLLAYWFRSKPSLKKNKEIFADYLADRDDAMLQVQNAIVNNAYSQMVEVVKKDQSLSPKQKSKKIASIDKRALRDRLIGDSKDVYAQREVLGPKVEKMRQDFREKLWGIETSENDAGSLVEWLTRSTNLLGKPKFTKGTIAHSLAENDLTMLDLGMYMYASMAEARNKRHRDESNGEKQAGSGMPDEVAQEFLKEFEKAGKTEALEAQWQRIRKMTESIVAKELEAGIITETQAEAMLKFDEGRWAPLYVEQFHATKGDRYKGSVISGVYSSGIKKAKGSDEHTYDQRTNPLVSWIIDYERRIARVEQQKALTSFAKLVESTTQPTQDAEGNKIENPNLKFWRIEKTKKVPSELDENGIPTKFDDFTSKEAQESGIPFLKDGKLTYIVLKDARLKKMYETAKRDEGTSAFFRTMGVMNNFYRVMFLNFSTDWALSNLTRDIQTAMVNLQAQEADGIARKVIKGIPDAVRALVKYENGSRDMSDPTIKMIDEQRNAGGYVASINYNTGDKVFKEIAKLVEQHDKSRQRKGGPQYLPLSGARKILRGLFIYGKVMENAIRTSTYIALKESGFSDLKAAQAALNVTVNFNKSGYYSRVLSSFYLFANAKIRGAYTLATNLIKDPKSRKVVAGFMIASVVQRMLLDHLSDDDDEKLMLKTITPIEHRQKIFLYNPYPWAMEKLKLKERYNKLPIQDRVAAHILSANILPVMANVAPKKENTFITIPISYELQPFKAMSDNIYTTIKGTTTPTEAAIDVVDAIMAWGIPGWEQRNSYGLPVPTLTQPLAEIDLNKKLAFDQPVQPEPSPYGIKKPDSENYFKNTPIPYIYIADKLSDVYPDENDDVFEISPNSIEHMANWLSGGLKSSISTLINTGEVMAGTKDEVDFNKLPVVRRFYQDLNTQQWRFSKYFFEQAKKGTTSKMTQKEYDLLAGEGAQFVKMGHVDLDTYVNELKAIWTYQIDSFSNKLELPIKDIQDLISDPEVKQELLDKYYKKFEEKTLPKAQNRIKVLKGQ